MSYTSHLSLFIIGITASLFSAVSSPVRAQVAESFQRGEDLEGWAAMDPGVNGHASLRHRDQPVWRYWAAPRDASWTDAENWTPLGFARSWEFRERANGEGENRYFKLHDYYAEAQGFGLYWNWKPEVEMSALAKATLLTVFTAPVDGDYRLTGQMLWRHWPGPGLNDGSMEIWHLTDDGGPKLLASVALTAVESNKNFEPIPWAEDLEGQQISLDTGDRLVFRLVGARSQYRGLDVDDGAFRIERLLASAEQPVPAVDTEVLIRARQLETLLDWDFPELAATKESLESGNFAQALERFQQAFLQLSSTIRSVDFPSQWLYNTTQAQDVRRGQITTLVYGGDEHLTFEVGAPGEVPWDSLGRERYPNLLRDLSTMHWVAALADTEHGGGEPGDAALWLGYWADLAERWTVQYAAMIQDPEMIALLPRQSLRWPGAAPLYFGWRLNNFFSWLPVVADAVAKDSGDAASAPDPMNLAAILVWLASDEIPTARRILSNPRGVPNQRRLLAAGLLQAGATMRWFKGIDPAVESAKDFIREMVEVEILPDGGSLEQSLNYNKALPHEIDNYLAMDANLPEALAFSDEMVTFLIRGKDYRYALIEALLRPDGTPPTIGKNNPYTPFDPWPEHLEKFPLSQALKAAFDGDASGLAFTSVYFPWSGYVALRTDWSDEAAYSVFQNSRPGLGHHRESVLRLDVAAFGAELLVNSGSEQYGNKGNYNAYFQATVSQNSISVDGYSQLAHAKGHELPYKKPIPARWMSSESFDFVEGVYDGYYGGWNFLENGAATVRDVARESTAVVKDASHSRRILFLREIPLWVVVDEVKSESPRTFTQTWNFSPEFGPDALQIDEAGLHIVAVEPSHPSVELLQFADAAIQPKYEAFHGVHAPKQVLGWVSKDRAPQAYDFAAANDLHVSWKSEGRRWLVTVIAPSADGTPRIVDQKIEGASRMIKLASGERVEIGLPAQAAEASRFQVTLWQAEDSEASTEEDSGRAESVRLLEVTMEPEEVRWRKGLEAWQPIPMPSGFYWSQDAEGRWQPGYSQPGPEAYGY